MPNINLRTSPNYHKRFRSDLKNGDPIDNETKNLKRANVLNAATIHPKLVLEATINYLTNQAHSEELEGSLGYELLSEIEYLTANSTEYGCFGIGVKDIPAGAAHILFAAAFALRGEIKDFDENSLQLRSGKIELLNRVINHLVQTQKAFPNLPRDKSSNIIFNDAEYFDDCQVEFIRDFLAGIKDSKYIASGELQIGGRGYVRQTYFFSAVNLSAAITESLVSGDAQLSSHDGLIPLSLTKGYTPENGIFSLETPGNKAPTHIKKYGDATEFIGGFHRDSPNYSGQDCFSKSIEGNFEKFGNRLYADVCLVYDAIVAYFEALMLQHSDMHLENKIQIAVNRMAWNKNGHYITNSKGPYYLRKLIEDHAIRYFAAKKKSEDYPELLIIPLDIGGNHAFMAVDFSSSEFDEDNKLRGMTIVYCDPRGIPLNDSLDNNKLKPFLEDLKIHNKVITNEIKQQSDKASNEALTIYYAVELIKFYIDRMKNGVIQEGQKDEDKKSRVLCEFSFIPITGSLLWLKLNIMNMLNNRSLTKLSLTNEILLIDKAMLRKLYDEQKNQVNEQIIIKKELLDAPSRAKLFSIDPVRLQKGINAGKEDAKKALTLLIKVQIDIEEGTQNSIASAQKMLQEALLEQFRDPRWSWKPHSVGLSN